MTSHTAFVDPQRGGKQENDGVNLEVAAAEEPPTVPSFQRDLTRVNAELFDPSICQVKPFKSLKAPKKSCMRAGCNVCTCLAVPCCCDAVSEVSRAIVFSQPLVNAELVYSCVRGAGKNPGLLLRKGRSCVRERGTEQYRSPLEPELKPRESSKASRRWFVAVDPGGRMAEPSSRAAGAPGGLRVKETSREVGPVRQLTHVMPIKE
ncbi:uncharacterized protein LOC104914163 [Meleagris gallopavo]|uniref:uncharacterized protein LOC104914163 n=1 Tax=Meleagris gallopavo TaxID=9103 RepID=UPI000549C865|nr:uncharacterized protein LOC104914163 [Meleagris gallopavo]